MKWHYVGAGLITMAAAAFADSGQTPIHCDVSIASIESPPIFVGGYDIAPQPVIAIIEKTSYSNLILLLVAIALVCTYLVWADRKKKKEDQTLETEQSPRKEIPL